MAPWWHDVRMILVVAAVLVDDLVRPTTFYGVRRSYPSTLRGRWEFPGGKVEPGESPLDALSRELREELQLAVITGPELVGPSPVGWPLGGDLVMRTWLARTDADPVVGHSHDLGRWFTAADADSVPWLDGDGPIVRAIVQSVLAPKSNRMWALKPARAAKPHIQLVSVGKQSRGSLPLEVTKCPISDIMTTVGLGTSSPVQPPPAIARRPRDDGAPGPR